MAITSDGAYAYVANDGSSTSFHDKHCYEQVTATITVGNGPYGVALTPNDAYAYVANYNSATVSVINLAPTTISSTSTPLPSTTSNQFPYANLQCNIDSVWPR